MTIATTLQQEKVQVPKTEPKTETRASCSIDGGIIRRIIVVVYFLALTVPTLAVFIIPDPQAFIIYSAYLFVAMICMIPTSLVYLASTDSRLVIYRTQSSNLRVKFTPIDVLPTYVVPKAFTIPETFVIPHH